jgi:hypothetical protein
MNESCIPMWFVKLHCTFDCGKVGHKTICNASLAPLVVSPVDNNHRRSTLSLRLYLLYRSVSVIYFLVVLVSSLVDTAKEFKHLWLIYASHWAVVFNVIDSSLKLFITWAHRRLTLRCSVQRTVTCNEALTAMDIHCANVNSTPQTGMFLWIADYTNNA